MNLYLLELVSKWISIFVVMFANFVGNIQFGNTTISIDNVNNNKNINIVSNIINYDTIFEYNEKLPSTIKNVLVPGAAGLSYTDASKNVNILKEPVSELIEVGTGPVGEYVGKLTGYGPDCPGCSAVGNVACHTREKTNHSLINDGIYYDDYEFGEVRILAADFTLFGCGTIIKVENSRLGTFYGVVLDTGSAMNNAWRTNHNVLLDLAFEKEEGTRYITQSNIKYSVQRWGW
jgi:3D (Asp-Asp-Asp) domain-containing protein